MYLGKFWSFNAFVIVRTKLSKYWSVKVSIAYMHLKPEIKNKKMIPQQWLQQQIKFALLDYWKSPFDGEGITLLIGEDVIWWEEIFMVAERSKFLAVG